MRQYSIRRGGEKRERENYIEQTKGRKGEGEKFRGKRKVGKRGGKLKFRHACAMKAFSY